MKPFNMENPIQVNNIETGDVILHGDVIIERINSLPNDFNNYKKVEDNCLAHGELTGHMHKLFGDEFELKEDTNNIKYLRLVKPIALRHQEHREITLPPGEYRIGIQREYDPFEKLIRQVQD
jgi:hypothetical protein